MRVERWRGSADGEPVIPVRDYDTEWSALRQLALALVIIAAGAYAGYALAMWLIRA